MDGLHQSFCEAMHKKRQKQIQEGHKSSCSCLLGQEHPARWSGDRAVLVQACARSLCGLCCFKSQNKPKPNQNQTTTCSSKKIGFFVSSSGSWAPQAAGSDRHLGWNCSCPQRSNLSVRSECPGNHVFLSCSSNEANALPCCTL